MKETGADVQQLILATSMPKFRILTMKKLCYDFMIIMKTRLTIPSVRIKLDLAGKNGLKTVYDLQSYILDVNTEQEINVFEYIAYLQPILTLDLLDRTDCGRMYAQRTYFSVFCRVSEI